MSILTRQNPLDEKHCGAISCRTIRECLKKLQEKLENETLVPLHPALTVPKLQKREAVACIPAIRISGSLRGPNATKRFVLCPKTSIAKGCDWNPVRFSRLVGVTNARALPNGQADMADKTEDWEGLLEASNAGDSASYALFLRRIAPVLRGIIRARGADLGHAICEDVLQEVLLAIHLKRHTWEKGSPVRPWLYAITRYKVADAFRARGRRTAVPIEDFVEVLEAEAEPDPTEASDMSKLIGMLDGRSAEIVRRIGLDGESAADVGAALSMTEGTVRVALHRALRKLASLRERHVE